MSADDIARPPSLNDPRYQQPQEEDEGPRFIGRPPADYLIERGEEEVPAPFDPRLQGRTDILPGAATVRQPRFAEPQYLEGQEYADFAGLSPEQIAAIQAEMLRAGVIDPDDFRPGVWDPESASGMKDVMEHANYAGLTWDQALQELAEAERAGVRKERQGRGYMAPDYATLAQAAKSAVRQNLGREPEDWEVKLLADEMGGGYREQIAQQQQFDQYEQQIALGEAEPGETFRAVDPKARFAERFEELYRPEIEAEQREEDASTNTQLLMRSITGMDRTVGS